MASKIFSLPPELLDRVFFYLDWNSTDNLTLQDETRRSLFDVSLTCKALRAAVTPLIFRNVTLLLQWKDGRLVEPQLFRLRRDLPHLARYIRCVQVVAKPFGPSAKRQTHPLFVLPRDVVDWTRPAKETQTGDGVTVELRSTHRQCVDRVSQDLYESLPESLRGGGRWESAEDVVRRAVGETHYAFADPPAPSEVEIEDPDTGVSAYWWTGPNAGQWDNVTVRSLGDESLARLRADGLAVAMLCIPPTARELILEARHDDFRDRIAYIFAMTVSMSCVQIVADRLLSLTVINQHPFMSRNNEWTSTTQYGLTAEVMSRLTKVNKLSLAPTALHQRNRCVTRGSRIVDHDLERWFCLSPTVTELHIWNTVVDEAPSTGFVELLHFISGFQALKRLGFHDMEMQVASGRGGEQETANIDPSHRSLGKWLSGCMSIRRAAPRADISICGLSCQDGALVMPASAVEWILTEAIPAGAHLDMNREQRLAEDFESFLPLWFAEDGERGKSANADPSRALLVDVAMRNRSRQFR